MATQARMSEWRRCFVYLDSTPNSIAVCFIPCAVHQDVSDNEAVQLLLKYARAKDSRFFVGHRFHSNLEEWNTDFLPKRFRRDRLIHVTADGCTKGLPKVPNQRLRPHGRKTMRSRIAV